jgi:hypothetical protein
LLEGTTRTFALDLFIFLYYTFLHLRLDSPHIPFIMAKDQFSQLVEAIIANKQTVTGAADDLHSALSQHEKLWLLDGDLTPMQWIKESIKLGYCGKPVVAGAIAKFGFPGIRFSDGPRGINTGTCFPVPSTRANTFNVDLEEQIVSRVGRYLRRELKIRGEPSAKSCEQSEETISEGSASILRRIPNGDVFKNLLARTLCWLGRWVQLSPRDLPKTSSPASSTLL